MVHEKESGVLFFVFEFMDGGNLYSKIKLFPEGMPEDKVRSIMCVSFGIRFKSTCRLVVLSVCAVCTFCSVSARWLAADSRHSFCFVHRR